MADSSRNILLALLVVGVAVAVFYMMDPTLGGLVKEGFQDMVPSDAQTMPMEEKKEEAILPPNNPPSASGMQVEKFASGPDQKKEIDGLLAASQALGKALSDAANKKPSNSGFANQKKEQYMNYEKKKEMFQGANGDAMNAAAPAVAEGFQNQASASSLPSANCYPKNQLAPQELLPADQASKWAEVNPTGAGDISGKNFLNAGALIGVNTVGQSLRNANQQLRSEPPCPQVNVSIWNQSTIEPDLQRRPLEGF